MFSRWICRWEHITRRKLSEKRSNESTSQQQLTTENFIFSFSPRRVDRKRQQRRSSLRSKSDGAGEEKQNNQQQGREKMHGERGREENHREQPATCCWMSFSVLAGFWSFQDFRSLTSSTQTPIHSELYGEVNILSWHLKADCGRFRAALKTREALWMLLLSRALVRLQRESILTRQTTFASKCFLVNATQLFNLARTS